MTGMAMPTYCIINDTCIFTQMLTTNSTDHKHQQTKRRHYSVKTDAYTIYLRVT